MMIQTLSSLAILLIFVARLVSLNGARLILRDEAFYRFAKTRRAH